MPTGNSELRELLGSMVIVGVRGAEPGDEELERDLDVCATANVGGVILFDVDLPTRSDLVRQGVGHAEATRRAERNITSPGQVAGLIQHIRSRLGPDTIVAVDHEGGATTRLLLARGFAETHSAAAFSSLSKRERSIEAARLASIAAEVGVTLNFAPCVDLLLHDANPIIGAKGRSFGGDPNHVVQCALEIIQAHRIRGVMTCLKHFPGHGSATVDSHRSIPDITDSATRDVERAPYTAMIPSVDETTWVMTGHLLDRRVDETYPASLSAAHTASVLRDELGFESVIATDSLDMGAIAQRWTIEEAAVLAVNAGADVVLDGVNAPGPRRACPALQIVDALEAAVLTGAIDGGVERIAESATRIARARNAVLRAH